MKNVAKCDTWCELQNPVNHRVFERKLRPKPLGRGHACLGVTHPSPPHLPSLGTRGTEGADIGLPWAPKPAVGRKSVPRRRTPRRAVDSHEARLGVARVTSRRDENGPGDPRSRPQVRRDHPLSLSISISGGKETYKDSPSNGERTGKSPA
jgi:hypothetical protein